MKIKLEMKNCNMILTEEQQKYQHYHLEKLANMNILQVKKYYHYEQIVETKNVEANFAYSPLGKAFEKQTKRLKMVEKNK